MPANSHALFIVVLVTVFLHGCGGSGNFDGGANGSSRIIDGTGAALVSLAIRPDSGELATGAVRQLTATGTYDDNSVKDITAGVTWSTSSADVATVDGSGVVTALAPGSTTVMARSENILGSVTLTVTSSALLSISVGPPDQSIALGMTDQFTATGTYSDNSMRDLTSRVTWTSSDAGVATVSGSGLASSVAEGTAAISASWGGITGSTNLTVTPATLLSIAVDPADAAVGVGETQQFTAAGAFSDGSTRDLTASVTWSSSAAYVATVSDEPGSKGSATALAGGTTSITARFVVTAPFPGSVSGSTSLTVTGAGDGTVHAASGGEPENVMAISVNGPACTNTLQGGYINKPCVSVTVCSPGTTDCQTIPDILLDTGSSGLRVFKEALSVPLTQVTDGGAGSIANCVQYGDGSSQWGPVQMAGVILGNEPVVNVPILVIDSTFGSRPSGCLNASRTPSEAGFNGILGVSLFAQDCGPVCAALPNNRMYYSCRGANCSGTTVSLSNQIQNPVALLPVDNNGVIVQLPSIPPGGALSAEGQLLLGIGTRSNNEPAGVTAYPASRSGHFITVFNGSTYSGSFIDSGSNGLFIPAPESLLPLCSLYTSWFCPDTTTDLAAVNMGSGGYPSGTVSFQIGNTVELSYSHNKVFAELGGPVPGGLDFDWGLPFFFGRSVYVGIEGKASSLGNGPYWAY